MPEFDRLSEAEGVEVKRLGPRASNLNAYAERWVRTVKQQCLDHFAVLGEAHVRYILTEYVAYDNEERPHQGNNGRSSSRETGLAGSSIRERP